MKQLLFLFLFSSIFPAYGVQTDSLRNIQDTTYIQSYKDKLIIKLDLDNDFIRFKLSGNDFKYDIRPNLGPNRTLSFNYRYAYLAVSYLPDFFIENKWNERRGKTSGWSIGTGITAPRFLFDIQYMDAQGFYLYNTSDYVPGWNSDTDPYIQFPDLKIWMLRGTVLYKTNPNFSLRAIQSQTEAQRKSATSLLPGISYNYYVIDNKGQSSPSSQRSYNLLLLAQLNYYATLVLHKKFYATAGLGASGGFYYTWLLTRQASGNIESTISDGVFRGSFNGGLGYNSNRFIAGAEVLYYQSFSKQPNNIDMVFTRMAFQLFIGYRFNESMFLKNGADKLEHLFQN